MAMFKPARARRWVAARQNPRDLKPSPINAINPRLLVLETHNIVPGDRSITIEYRPDFNRADRPASEQDFMSASLLAMQKPCKRRGYRLIGAHRHGFNAFFLHEDEDQKFLRDASLRKLHFLDVPIMRRSQFE
jgi:hypothetical protein